MAGLTKNTDIESPATEKPLFKCAKGDEGAPIRHPFGNTSLKQDGKGAGSTIEGPGTENTMFKR